MSRPQPEQGRAIMAAPGGGVAHGVNPSRMTPALLSARNIPGGMLGGVRARWFSAVATLIAVSGCGLVPWTSYGEPHPNCRGFDPDVPLEWAGFGTPDQFGLWPEALPDLVPGAIYVGVMLEPSEPDRWWCHIPNEGSDTNWGAVPEDWVRPP